MLNKLTFALLGCLVPLAATAGACHGSACRYLFIGKDDQGCLEFQNTGRDDMQITVYTAGSGALQLTVAGGFTEKLYRTGRQCILAVDYVRSEAEFEGGIFAPRH